MPEVIDLNSRRIDPHLQGRSRCLDCAHEEETVAPVGTVWFECSKCGGMRMHLINPIGAQPGDTVFVCNCGSEYFTAIMREGSRAVLCSGCGSNHAGNIDLFLEDGKLSLV